MNETLYHFKRIKYCGDISKIPAYHDLLDAIEAAPEIGSFIRLRDGYDAQSSTCYQVEEESRGGAGRGQGRHPIFGERMERHAITLSRSEWEKLKEIGAGNASDAIRTILG